MSEPAAMDDRGRLEEHALQRDRLMGVFLHGTDWRERSGKGTTRRLLAGVVLGIVLCALVAAGSFVSSELGLAGAVR